MAEEVQWASHGAIKAMELHDEPIAVKIVVPMEPQIRLYITIGGGYPSKLQSPHSEEEDDTNSPTGNPHWGWGTLQYLQAELGDLADQELWPLMEISVRRSHLMSCMLPPAILNQLPGVNPEGAVILMRMTRRSPFQEGEGGFP